VFIRYSFPFYPRYKHRLQLLENQYSTWRKATAFKPNVKRNLRRGTLTVFVISGTHIEVFDKGNPGEPI